MTDEEFIYHIGGLIEKAMANTVNVVNPERKLEAERACEQLRQIVLACDDDAKIDIKVDPGYHSIDFVADAISFTVNDPQEFAKIISKASNFEIDALTNGKIHFTATFYGVFKTIGKL